MPWKETCPMDQRVAFIADWLRDEWTMSALAERYGISRKTGYKWLDRYGADRDKGLADRSRAPKIAAVRRRRVAARSGAPGRALSRT
jgi:transposase-like protein